MSYSVSLNEWLRRWNQPENVPRLTILHRILVEMYDNSQRYYHNLDHVAACLGEYGEVEKKLVHPFEVWLAIWFHDAVYDPGGKTNEEASRDYAVQVLGGLIGKDSMNVVSSLIMTTRHDTPDLSDDERFIADIDLAILGRDEHAFDEYEEGIRMEYKQVAEEEFRKGRAEVLMGFLERGSIYHTDYFREKYEEKARTNLRRSIAELSQAG